MQKWMNQSQCFNDTIWKHIRHHVFMKLTACYIALLLGFLTKPVLALKSMGFLFCLLCKTGECQRWNHHAISFSLSNIGSYCHNIKHYNKITSHNRLPFEAKISTFSYFISFLPKLALITEYKILWIDGMWCISNVVHVLVGMEFFRGI